MESYIKKIDSTSKYYTFDIFDEADLIWESSEYTDLLFGFKKLRGPDRMKQVNHIVKFWEDKQVPFTVTLVTNDGNHVSTKAENFFGSDGLVIAQNFTQNSSNGNSSSGAAIVFKIEEIDRITCRFKPSDLEAAKDKINYRRKSFE